MPTKAAETKILSALARPWSTSAAIAQMANMTPSAVHHVLEKLQNDGRVIHRVTVSHVEWALASTPSTTSPSPDPSL